MVSRTVADPSLECVCRTQCPHPKKGDTVNTILQACLKHGDLFFRLSGQFVSPNTVTTRSLDPNGKSGLTGGAFAVAALAEVYLGPHLRTARQDRATRARSKGLGNVRQARLTVFTIEGANSISVYGFLLWCKRAVRSQRTTNYKYCGSEVVCH